MATRLTLKDCRFADFFQAPKNNMALLWLTKCQFITLKKTQSFRVLNAKYMIRKNID